MMSTRLLLLNLMLVSAAVIFSVLLVRGYLSSPDLPPAPPPRTPQVALLPMEQGPPARAPLAAYEVVATRNLFNPARSETAAAVPAPSGKLFLYGIVLQEGAPVAFLGDPTTRKVRGYKPGDQVGDGELERIEVDRVVIRRNEDTFEVLLRDPRKPKPVAAPVQSRSGVSAKRPRPPQSSGAKTPPAAVRPRPPSPSLFRRPQAPAVPPVRDAPPADNERRR